jgi:hypothetical protein
MGNGNKTPPLGCLDSESTVNRKGQDAALSAHFTQIQLGSTIAEPEGTSQILDLRQVATTQCMLETGTKPVFLQGRRNAHTHVLWPWKLTMHDMLSADGLGFSQLYQYL